MKPTDRRGTVTGAPEGRRLGLLLPAPIRHILRPAILVAAAIAISASVSGCAAGIALAVLGIVSLGDDDGGPSVVLPPVVEDLRVRSPETSERVHVEFRVAGKRGGSLRSRLEYIPLSRTGDGDLVPAGVPVPATPAPGSGSLDGFASGETVTFIWDAGGDLAGRDPFAQVVLTPSEGTVEGEPVTSGVVHAGRNTPVVVENVQPASQGSLLVVSFALLDLESDPVTLEKVEVGIDGGEPSELPPEVLGTAARRFPSAPSPGGASASFLFRLEDLASAPGSGGLAVLSEPGFVGEVLFRLSVRDFPSEPEPSVGVGAFRLDLNDPPLVEILALPSESLGGGAVPIRYRILDRERNAADLRVEVDRGDSDVVVANELPLTVSEGRRCLASLDPALYGDPNAPSHVFLWDAGSQVRSGEAVTLVLAARDREEGPASRLDIDGVALSGLRRAGPLQAYYGRYSAVGDFNNDGHPDLALSEPGVSLLRGGPGGLEPWGEVRFEGDYSSLKVAAGDFDGDGFDDLFVLIARYEDEADEAWYYRGGPEGLTAAYALSAGLYASELRLADFDRDGYLDAVIQSQRAEAETTLFSYRGGPRGLRLDRTLELGRDSRGEWAIADFDGDEFPDIVVADVRGLFYVRGARTGLAVVGRLELQSKAASFLTGDFDGDAYLDLVCTASGLRYLRGGPWGLRLEWTFAMGEAGFEAADYNRDGSLDLVASTSEELLSFPGGPGGIGRGGPIDTREANWRTRPLSGDFDGDGYLDLLATSYANTATFYGGGPAGLQRVREIRTPESVRNLLGADFDADGFQDALLAYTETEQVTLLRGGETGPAIVEHLRVYSDEPSVLVPGDFDGDGAMEVVATHYGSSVQTYLQMLPPDLEPVGDVGVGGIPGALASGDFDGDGFADLLVAAATSGGVACFRGCPRGFGASSAVSLGDVPSAVAVGDFDSDGLADALIASGSGKRVAYLRGSAEGLTLAADLPVGEHPEALGVGDFDGDGVEDAIALDGVSGTATFLRGSAEGLSKGEGIPLSLGEGALALATADCDGDGILDAAVACAATGSVRMLRGSSSGPQPNGAPISVGMGPLVLATADFDGDGSEDVAVSCAGAGTVSFLRGGEAGLTVAGELPVGEGPEAIATGDLDGDGFPDAAVLNRERGNITYLRGGPDGLEAAGEIDAGEMPWELLAGDLNGDGIEDLLVANPSSDVLTFVEGRPGGPVRRYEIDAGNGPALLTRGDFDGDGQTDLALANGNSEVLTHFRRRYLVAHANRLLDPAELAALATGGPLALVDPRHRPSYRLELPAGSLSETTQVCLVPGPAVALPQAEAFARGRYLLVATDPVSLLRESTELLLPATLTLRIREEPAGLPGDVLAALATEPGRLRILRHDAASGRYEESGIAGSAGRIVDFRGAEGGSAALPLGKGISFPVVRFGSYVVAIEKDRGSAVVESPVALAR